MTFEQILTAYVRDSGVTRSLRRAIICWWPMFSVFCRSQGLTEVSEVTPHHLEAFQQNLQWQPTKDGRLYAANTVYHSLLQIRKVLRWATERGHVSLDPGKEMVLGIPLRSTPRRLTWEELQAILAAPDRSQPKGLRDAAILTLLAETQWTAVRCVTLDVGDEVRLRLEDSTRSLLAAYLQKARPLWARHPEEKALFLTHMGYRLGVQTVANVLDEAARIAGVEGKVIIRMLGRSYQAELQSSGQRLPLAPR